MQQQCCTCMLCWAGDQTRLYAHQPTAKLRSLKGRGANVSPSACSVATSGVCGAQRTIHQRVARPTAKVQTSPNRLLRAYGRRAISKVVNSLREKPGLEELLSSPGPASSSDTRATHKTVRRGEGSRNYSMRPCWRVCNNCSPETGQTEGAPCGLACT